MKIDLDSIEVFAKFVLSFDQSIVTRPSFLCSTEVTFQFILTAFSGTISVFGSLALK